MRQLYLAASPPDTVAAQRYGLPLAHMAYAVGAGLTLQRGQIGTAMRGGLMVIHDRHYDRSPGDVGALCAEIMRECSLRDFTGVICDFEQPVRRALEMAVSELGELLSRKQYSLIVTERYSHLSAATLLVSSAATSGTLRKHWEEPAKRFQRPLAVEIDPLARDFLLTQSGEQGKAITPAVLHSLIAERQPTVFFSTELCAHYFTYKDELKNTHFVLFDDANSLARKIMLARSLEADPIILLYPDVRDIMPEILSNIT